MLFVNCRAYFGYQPVAREYLKAATWVVLAAFSYAYNDLCDLDIDKINKPKRPLPSGALSLGSARKGLAIMFALILVLSVAVWRADIFWPLVALVGGVAYSRVIRTWNAFLSNVVASVLVAIVPLSGLPLRGNPQGWMLILSITLLMLAREIQKDALDAEGDRICRPLPVLYGSHARAFLRAYPCLLLISAWLLYLTLSHPSNSLALTCWSALPASVTLAAFVSVFAKRGDHQVQVSLIKGASYLLVIILAFGRGG